MEKVLKMKNTGGKMAIKTWARRSQIPPEFVGQTFLVHQGKNFITVFIGISINSNNIISSN